MDLVSYILQSGGDIHSTCKQVGWIPFVHDLNLIRNNDKREVVKKQGVRMLKLKKTNVNLGNQRGQVLLTVGAYRNGRGSVCLFMTTITHRHEWDFIPSSFLDSLRHQTDDAIKKSRRKGFVLEHVNSDRILEKEQSDFYDKCFETFDSLPCQMVTRHQSNLSWFIA